MSTESTTTVEAPKKKHPGKPWYKPSNKTKRYFKGAAYGTTSALSLGGCAVLTKYMEKAPSPVKAMAYGTAAGVAAVVYCATAILAMGKFVNPSFKERLAENVETAVETVLADDYDAAKEAGLSDDEAEVAVSVLAEFKDPESAEEINMEPQAEEENSDDKSFV